MCMTDLEVAIKLLESENYTCVAVKGESRYFSHERGIKPLVAWQALTMQGYSVADKIVGKAAAFLYAKLRISKLYAKVLSEGGKAVLDSYNIPVKYGTLTANIINRKGDGICPMERAVKDISDCETAYKTLCDELAKMSQK